MTPRPRLVLGPSVSVAAFACIVTLTGLLVCYGGDMSVLRVAVASLYAISPYVGLAAVTVVFRRRFSLALVSLVGLVIASGFVLPQWFMAMNGPHDEWTPVVLLLVVPFVQWLLCGVVYVTCALCWTRTDATKEHIVHLTRMLRTSSDPFWAQLRVLFVMKGLDLQQVLLAESCPDESGQEVGIIVTKDGTVLRFIVDSGRGAVNEDAFKEWTDVTAHRLDDAYSGNIRTALAMWSTPSGDLDGAGR